MYDIDALKYKYVNVYSYFAVHSVIIFITVYMYIYIVCI